jgi:hypothetical protein
MTGSTQTFADIAGDPVDCRTGNARGYREPVALARIRTRLIERGSTLQGLARHTGAAFQRAHKYGRGLSRVLACRLYRITSALKTPFGFSFAAGDAIDRERPGAKGAVAGSTRAALKSEVRGSRVDGVA